ncbi:MAG TPA: BACON domain-containing carbohydrate-binding protein, partial [Candidatus Acidoferrales bacterium]|nr:BACON domain-containing carbohydrate-binding protein [Candidatus Acidoferrales bacterium]
MFRKNVCRFYHGLLAWSVTNNAPSWITVVNGPNFIGTNTIFYNVSPNPGSARQGTLTVAGGELFTVRQAGALPLALFRDSTGAIRLSTYGSPAILDFGGQFPADPSAAKDTDGNIFTAVRDSFNGIWTTFFDVGSATRGAWQAGGGVMAGNPSIAVAPTGTAWI